MFDFSPAQLWRQLRQRLLGHLYQRRKSRFLLLLRLENLPLLTQRLGQAGISHLMVHLSMRLGTAIRPHDPVEIAAPGTFSIRVQARHDAEAMAIARRVQAQGQTMLSVAGQEVTPVLTGALIAGDAGMTDQARRRLAAIPASGLGQISLFDADSRTAPQALPVSVAEAAAHGQLVAYFQPQLCCNSGRVTGFEALVRWNHPSRGILPPAAFMPGMTDADHDALTQAMLRQALDALKVWDAAGHPVPTVSVNISNAELGKAGFVSALLWELDRRDIAPQRLVLEILESVGPVTTNPRTRQNLARLAAAGCRLDLDDFGTGYASLDAIRQFGIHRIKIDRSFVMACDIDPAQQRMVLAILALAERLEIATLAEGVETREEHSFLAQLGCDEVQGYAIARPMPLDDTLRFLTQHAGRVGALPRLDPRKAG